MAACREPQRPAATDRPPTPQPAWFVDGTVDAGLDFVHDNGMTGQFHQTEIMGPGAALFDYDNDGDLDVYLVQGGPLRAASSAERGGRDRLYRNDLTIDGTGTHRVRLTDVTAASRIEPKGQGMGIAVGDVDNDGWSDIYLTGFGRNQLFRNNGDGTFADISKSSGLGDPAAWSVSASFFDYDRDGLLDLFVGNYLTYSLAGSTRTLPTFIFSGIAIGSSPLYPAIATVVFIPGILLVILANRLRRT